MRKAKIYVDPRQEKLWPDIDYKNIDTTWKDLKDDFFGHIHHIGDWIDYRVEMPQHPVITVEDIERMAREMPPLNVYSGWPITHNHERRLQRELEMGQYGVQIRVPMASISMPSWEI